MSAIEGEFVTYKHIPTRAVFQIVIEAPEEAAPEVFAALGYPSSGKSLYVAVTRLYGPEERATVTEHHKNLEVDATSPEALTALLDAKLGGYDAE